MLHKILNLKGATEIEKKDQLKILGGNICSHFGICLEYGSHCNEAVCQNNSSPLEQE